MKKKAAQFLGDLNLKPKQKKIVVMLGLGVAMTIIGVLAYVSDSGKKSAPVSLKQSKNTVVSMDNNLLDKNQLLEAQKDAAVAREALAETKKQEDEKKRLAAAGLLAPPPAPQQQLPALPASQYAGNQKRSAALPSTPQSSSFALPPPPPMLPSTKQGSSNIPPTGSASAAVESEIGGISLVAGVERKTEKADDKKKDEKRSVYLPISYMEATLLSGLDAPTSSDAKGNPVPVLIRVKTPAVLPNEVKANLKGCFVIADGKGNLGTERAELVLVSLSCIDRRGQAVIDQSLTGYVVDADGKAGLRGRVVTKMGAMITRSMISGLFGGFGEALNSANTTTSITPIGGAISTIEPEKIGMAGLGKGLSSAFKDIQKFYMELAHQTMPVIEIGAARPITLVVTKGATLDIKKLKGGR